MTTRLISGAVIAIVVVSFFLLGPPWLTLGIAVLAALAAYETVQLVRKAGYAASLWLPVIAAAVAVVYFAFLTEPGFGLGLVAPGMAWALVAPGIAVVLMLAAVLAFRQQEPAGAFRAWLGTAFSALYPALLAFAAALVGLDAQSQTSSIYGIHLDMGRILLLMLVLTVWTLDSGAYLSGRAFGRRKMAPHISPNKTWEGSIGGTIAAVVVCAALAAGTDLTIVVGAVLGLVIAIAAQAGDLAESVLKRAAGAKDSGHLIPGHGGFLDRVDSFLFAAPALYAALALWAVAFTRVTLA